MKRYAKYMASLAIAAVTLAAIMGCATGREVPLARLTPHEISQVRSSARISNQSPTRPVVALVLGGGGLRGFAHIGVLDALEELGVQPDLIVGTSAGSIVGAAYASGLTPDQIKSTALNVKLSSLIDFSFSTQGLIRGKRLENWVDGVTGGVPIERFPRRFAAAATDLRSGRAVLLESGGAGSVVRASSAVPGMNVPVPYSGGHLVDGGVTSLVPVRFARAMGADIVIAVDIYCRSPRSEEVSVTKVLSSVMQTQSCLLAQPEMAQADVLISPEIAMPSMSSREAQEQVIRAGYVATYAAIENWKEGYGLRKPREERQASLRTEAASNDSVVLTE